ncbi:hypothetical protein FQA47_008286 [Oryzias melastigma]|uniref:Uncharacterized protein n=1 Tax=Oryzias melastigma TaxID=30732 RepID=A0A834CET2_ORYME|nr:hypothetical protein FQA47_008286 [Oryzias melastigma]
MNIFMFCSDRLRSFIHSSPLLNQLNSCFMAVDINNITKNSAKVIPRFCPFYFIIFLPPTVPAQPTLPSYGAPWVWPPASHPNPRSKEMGPVARRNSLKPCNPRHPPPPPPPFSGYLLFNRAEAAVKANT